MIAATGIIPLMKQIPEEKGYYTYMVRCSDDTLYTGWTVDLNKRLKSHNGKTGARYTRARQPVELAYYESLNTKVEAMQREWQIKQLTKKEKEELIAGLEMKETV